MRANLTLDTFRVVNFAFGFLRRKFGPLLGSSRKRAVLSAQNKQHIKAASQFKIASHIEAASKNEAQQIEVASEIEAPSQIESASQIYFTLQNEAL